MMYTVRNEMMYTVRNEMMYTVRNEMMYTVRNEMMYTVRNEISTVFYFTFSQKFIIISTKSASLLQYLSPIHIPF